MQHKNTLALIAVGAAAVTVVSANTVIKKREKEIERWQWITRQMIDTIGTFAAYVPPTVIQQELARIKFEDIMKANDMVEQ